MIMFKLLVVITIIVINWNYMVEFDFSFKKWYILVHDGLPNINLICQFWLILPTIFKRFLGNNYNSQNIWKNIILFKKWYNMNNTWIRHFEKSIIIFQNQLFFVARFQGNGVISWILHNFRDSYRWRIGRFEGLSAETYFKF